jgi:hypothetical protein
MFYAIHWHRYRRLRTASAPGVQRNFMTYVCDCWDVRGYRQLCRLLTRKALQLIRHGQSEPAQLGPDEFNKSRATTPNPA